MAEAVVMADEEESPEPGGTEPVKRTRTWAGGEGAEEVAGWAARWDRIPCGHSGVSCALAMHRGCAPWSQR